MRVLSPEESRSLLALPLICENYSDWVPWKLQPTSVVLTAGAVRQDGSSARLIVELIYTKTNRAKATIYRFTVFLRHPWGNEPVYQLHINQSHHAAAHAHSRPHEHVGSDRRQGDASWANWGYDEVLAYFCAQTNIEFRPPPPHPEHFALKS